MGQFVPTEGNGRNDSAGLPTEAERFGWLERPDDDFPYYRGPPVGISTGGWLLVLSGVALGFLVLKQGPKLVSGVPAKFLVVFLHWAIPLAVLAIMACMIVTGR